MKYTKEEKKRFTEYYHEELAKIINTLDAQERYFLTVILFASTHKLEDMPEEHREMLPIARESVPWRSAKNIMQINKASARKFAETRIVKERASERA